VTIAGVIRRLEIFPEDQQTSFDTGGGQREKVIGVDEVGEKSRIDETDLGYFRTRSTTGDHRSGILMRHRRSREERVPYQSCYPEE
jgi:hypothetical protein